MDSHHFEIRHVMNVQGLKEDPDALLALTGMIGWMISNDMLNVNWVGPESGFTERLEAIMTLLKDDALILVCSGDPNDPTEWRLEAGPMAASSLWPMNFSLN